MINDFCVACANAIAAANRRNYVPQGNPQNQEATIKTINDWAKAVHENAKAHGWYENPRQPGELLMLITCEVAEAMEEIRNGHGLTKTYYNEGKMQGVPSELADIVIRVMDFAEHYGIDLQAAIAEKHAYNVKRPYKHGGKLL